MTSGAKTTLCTACNFPPLISRLVDLWYISEYTANMLAFIITAKCCVSFIIVQDVTYPDSAVFGPRRTLLLKELIENSFDFKVLTLSIEPLNIFWNKGKISHVYLLILLHVFKS